MPTTKVSPKVLKERAYEIRRRDVQMVYEAGMGHIGGDMSARVRFTRR
jgi:transketolase N-terminal domain/subunit